MSPSQTAEKAFDCSRLEEACGGRTQWNRRWELSLWRSCIGIFMCWDAAMAMCLLLTLWTRSFHLPSATEITPQSFLSLPLLHRQLCPWWPENCHRWCKSIHLCPRMRGSLLLDGVPRGITHRIAKRTAMWPVNHKRLTHPFCGLNLASGLYKWSLPEPGPGACERCWNGSWRSGLW